MAFNDTEPQRAHGSGPDTAQEIRDSFQAVLDALDAARADLYAFDWQEGLSETPPPSRRQRSEPARDVGFTRPAPSLPPPPTPTPLRRTQPAGRGHEYLEPEPPHSISPPVVEPPRTGGLRQVHALRDVVVEPLWLRGAHAEAVPPPPVGKPAMGNPATASGAGPTHATPPVTFLPPAPPQEGALRGTGPRPDTTGSAVPQRPAPRPAPPADQLIAPPSKESPSPVGAHARNRHRGWRSFTERRDTRLTGAFGGVAVSGLILASSLLVNDNPAPAVPSPPSGQPDRPLPDNPAPTLPEVPGTGVLRQGDSGHGVYELQVRLRQVPDIYNNGAIGGRYDVEVRAAVARFQEWYGIRGDETGVYGDHTRHALMLRTT